MKKPELESIWNHANGSKYTVLMFSNEQTTKPEQYPVTIIYKDDKGQVWSRALDDWYRSMTEAK